MGYEILKEKYPFNKKPKKQIADLLHGVPILLLKENLVEISMIAMDFKK